MKHLGLYFMKKPCAKLYSFLCNDFRIMTLNNSFYLYACKTLHFKRCILNAQKYYSSIIFLY